MLGIGIIGCGAISSRRHVPEYTQNQSCKIVGVYDPNEERARELAKTCSAKVFATMQDLLSDTEIDAVSVCTSNSTHASVSIAALNAQKHVLCEKPMATTSKEAQEMIEAARRNNKILMIGQNQRLDPAHAMTKQILTSGDLGKVLSFQMAFSHSGPENWIKANSNQNVWFFRAAQSRFGVLGDLGVHKIDLICWLLDDDAHDVQAFTATLDKHFEDGSPIDVEDNAAIIIRFRSGVIGTVLCSWTSYGAEDNATVINCQHGIIKIYRDGEILSVIREDGTVQKYHPKNEKYMGALESSGVIDLFLEGIRTGKSPIPGEDGFRTLRIVERCLKL